jgi:lipoprotein NlpD
VGGGDNKENKTPTHKVQDKSQDISTRNVSEAHLHSEISWSWPHKGKILRGFEGGNKGIDIAGKISDPIFAAAEGKVLYVGSNVRGYGNLVIVKHSAAYLSAYAHNSQIFVKEGQAVTAGQKIAELGKSDSEQAKLHFEIRHQGKPVDPMQFLPKP